MESEQSSQDGVASGGAGGAGGGNVRSRYLLVRDAVLAAIDRGEYVPGRKMPSTKEVSLKHGVSLVTAHRALQELVSNGVLMRSQGRGTFVHSRYRAAEKVSTRRVGVLLRADTEFLEYRHAPILDQFWRACRDRGADVLLLRFAEDLRNECDAFLLIDPTVADFEAFAAKTKRHFKPTVVVGTPAMSPSAGGKNRESKAPICLDVSEQEIVAMAIDHLVKLGHRRIGYVGGDDGKSHASHDRWQTFIEAIESRGLAPPAEHHVVRALGASLDERERQVLVRGLTSGVSRPTAMFAAGYTFALDVYAAAASAGGLNIPDDLSVIGVDDLPSAAHLAPPLTTIRRPLNELARCAADILCDHDASASPSLARARSLPPSLVVRNSTAAAPRERG